ncbi:MAG: hypothetical protein V4466_09360 [Pseudomonadota bacterium]
MTDSSAAEGSYYPAATDLTATAFEKVTVNLYDLFRETMKAGKARVRNITFTDCRLEGPVVIAVMGRCTFEATNFGYSGGDVRALTVRSGAPGKIVGALPFEDCTFTGCGFVAVGFAGSSEFLDQIAALETK